MRHYRPKGHAALIVADRHLLARLRRAARRLTIAVVEDAVLTKHQNFLPWPEQAALYRERMRQPVERDGIRWIPTVAAAQACGINPHRLHMLSKKYAGNNEIIVADNGARFIRIPRERSDKRPPVYWDVDSLKAVDFPKQGRPRRGVLEEA